MGTEEIWVPLALTALSAGAGVYNANQTARKQDNTLAAQIRQHSALQREADQNVQKLIGKERALSSVPQQQAEANAMSAVRAANADRATAGLNVPGAVPKAYEAAKGNAALGITDYGERIGNLLSRMDAPQQARLDFTKNLHDYGSDISQLQRRLQGQDYLSMMKLNAIRPNPWITGLQGLASGAASAYAGGGGGSYGTAAAERAPNLANDLPDPWSSSGGLDEILGLRRKPAYSYLDPTLVQA